MVYPASLPLMRTPRLPVVDWTDAPAVLNGVVRFAERRNLVSARVPSHFKHSLSLLKSRSTRPTTIEGFLRAVKGLLHIPPRSLPAVLSAGRQERTALQAHTDDDDDDEVMPWTHLVGTLQMTAVLGTWHSTLITAIWNLKPEWWGSPFFFSRKGPRQNNNDYIYIYI